MHPILALSVASASLGDRACPMGLDRHRHAELSRIASLLDGISEQFSGVLVPILFLLFFWASSFACSLSIPSLFYTAVPQLSDFCVPPESRRLIFVLSSPRHGCIAHTAHFSCVISRHDVRRPDLVHSWCSRDALCKVVPVEFLDSPSSEFVSRGSRFRLCNSNQTYRWSLSDSSSNIVHSHRYLLRVGRRKVRSSMDKGAFLSNVAIPGWLITIRSSETIISSGSCPHLSSGPPGPLHDLDLALKSPATMIGPDHFRMLSSKSSRYAWNVSSDTSGE